MQGACALLCTAALLAAARAAPAVALRPNIFFIMADQLRFDAVGATGGSTAETPNLDRLAREGMAFTKAYTSTPTCTPARAALLTGQSPWKHGMLGYGAVALRYPYEMPATMAQHGYYTASFGKDHYGWNATTNRGIDHGFMRTLIYDGMGDGQPLSNDTDGFDDYDRWFQQENPGKDPLGTGLDWNEWKGRPYIYEERYHPTAWLGENARNFIDSYNDSRSLFMKISFHRPHSPYDPPPRVFNAVRGRIIPVPAVSDTWDKRFRGLPEDPPGCGPWSDDAWCGLMPHNETVLTRQAYYASVTFVDEWIGHILRAIEKSKLGKNAFIIFTADHGDMQGDHYHWRKGFPYEGSAHIPMIIKWPESMMGGAKRGTKSSKVTELRDIFPTVLAAAGVTDLLGTPLPGLSPQEESHIRNLDGKPLTCLVLDPTGEACNWREWLDLEHTVCYNFSNNWNALTDGRFKYIFNAQDTSEQLFDLENDPGELVDLSSQANNTELVSKWRQRLVDLFIEQRRGEAFLSNSTLISRGAITYSPNYPVFHPILGSPIVRQECQGNSGAFNGETWIISNYTIALCEAWLDPEEGICDPEALICMAADTLDKGSALHLMPCDGSDPRQDFQVTWVVEDYCIIQNAKSGLCLIDKFNGTVLMDHCDISENAMWQARPLGPIVRPTSVPQCVTAMPLLPAP
eukprot:m.18977 g.18977  ORF g.18977 m.18977 type:complete len:686 (+) comp3710_c0_seq2:3-2060(+)